MNNKKKLILISILCLISVNQATLQAKKDYSDPLNLNNNNNIKTNVAPLNTTITSIYPDSVSNSITVQGNPDVSYIVKENKNKVDLVIAYSHLHPSLAHESYNWETKLRNSLVDVFQAQVAPDNNNRHTHIKLKFKYPVKVEVVKNYTGSVTFNFIKTRNLAIVSPEATNLNDLVIVSSGSKREFQYVNPSENVTFKRKVTIKPVDTSNDSLPEPVVPEKVKIKKETYTPDNTEINSIKEEPMENTIAEQGLSNNSSLLAENNSEDKIKDFKKTRKEAIENENKTIFAPDVEESIEDIPPDLPEPNLSQDNKPQPESYSRQDNQFSDSPKKLPALERPEKTTNDLLNKTDYDDLMLVANNLINEGKLKDSIQKYQQAINVNSKRYEAYNQLGDVYFKLEEHKLAIENYTNALKIKNDLVSALFNSAISYKKLKEYTPAIINLTMVIELQPENYEAMYNLANLYFETKDYKKAIESYESCIKLGKKSKNNSETAKLYYNLANTYKAQKSPEKAIKSYKDAIKLFKEFADAHYNLAIAYIDAGDPPKAIEEFNIYKSLISDQQEINRVDKLIRKLKRFS